MPKSIVTKTTATRNLQADIKRLLSPLNSLISYIKPGDKVLIKPNFNTADPFPASSAIDFLEAVIKSIKVTNPSKIVLGDSSTLALKTEKAMKKLAIFKLGQRLNIEIINFDKEKFIKKKINGKYLKTIRIPKILEEGYKLILLPCLKTHRYSRFTMSLKLGVGFMKKSDRVAMHARNLEAKVAEINLAYQPNLIIMDGRKAFITFGPEKGDLVEPKILMASTDRIAIDVEALKILKSYPAENRLEGDIWQLSQIKRAVELNLGAKSEEEYETIEV